jgi:hypothetical protein
MYWHCRKQGYQARSGKLPGLFLWPATIDRLKPVLDAASPSHESEIPMTETGDELPSINTAWQIAMQEILRMVVRDIYKTGSEAEFKSHIKRIEEAAVANIIELKLRGTNEWTETLVKEKASNFVTTLLTSFTYDRV